MKRIGLIAIFLILVGCTKDVDFDQIDDVEIESTYIASLTYFNLVADDFLDEDLNELSQIEDFVMPDLNPENVENVLKLEFTFQFSNSFSRDFRATVLFFDADGNVVYQLEPPIDIARNTSEVQTVIFVVPPDIETIYGATTAGFFMELIGEEGEMLSPDSPGILNLQSSLTLYLSVKK